jgi:glycosyltransferase involved in cell wall biosynthesis
MTSIYALPISKIFGAMFINGMIRSAPQNIERLSKNWIRSKMTFPFSDIVLSNSRAGLKSYGVPSSKGVCIHNGFSFGRLSPDTRCHPKTATFAGQNDPIVGMVAAFTRKKDYQTFISAAKILIKEKSHVKFLMVGDGPTLEECKVLVPKEYKESVKFLGRRKDIESIIRLFDVAVLATNSKMHGEGISNSIMEYMASGKPVVATKGGGTHELVLHEQTGFLVNPFDAREMAIRINQLLEDRALARKMGLTGKTRIMSDFNIDKMTSAFIDLYRDLLSKRTTAGPRFVVREAFLD